MSEQKLPYGNRDRHGNSTFRYGDNHIETVMTISKQKLPYGNWDRHGNSMFRYGDHHIKTGNHYDSLHDSTPSENLHHNGRLGCA